MTKDIHLLILPGARLAPGMLLPEGFRFAFLGQRSSKWDTVGLLCSFEVEPSVFPLEDLSSDRVLWCRCVGKQKNGKDNILILCAFYAAPGGDLETWEFILSTFRTVRRKFSNAQVILAGDANIRLKKIVRHPPSCSCLHCKQPAMDAKIEKLIEEAGLVVLSDGTPTHMSGTIIDLVLAPREMRGGVTVEPEFNGGSDHKLVYVYARELSHAVPIWSGEGVVAFKC